MINMNETYCGNNRIHPTVVNGTARIGTMTECLRKGFGVGRRLPYDDAYTGLYEPLTDLRVHCGNGALPPGYAVSGTLPMCLQKGVGMGKRVRAQEIEQLSVGCPANHIRNPRTGRCVLRTGRIGMRILRGQI